MWSPLDVPQQYPFMQYGPVIYFMLHICSTPAGQPGPSQRSKHILLLASILYVPSLLPRPFWSTYIFDRAAQVCLLIFTPPDLVMVCDALALGLFFAFVRLEYLRNKELELFHYCEDAQQTADIDGFNIQDP
uniref:Uncharacterized protein n=1 Tax=Eutreptiella gymnastica TaxID=73025 RepID=A0A7S1NIT6_9EUGL|mmetsp:Transcript_41519/g.74489  ORF Transcript_41519/g.74489 Transcript_41519/m.74489 type:complete len:132 (+) Transcript_41519:141-536(+)